MQRETRDAKRETYTAFIGLGSNVGNRMACLRQAIARLRDHPGIVVTALSPVFETQALRGERAADDPPFLNAAVELSTALPPAALLTALQQIEEELGRPRRHPKDAPRTIDLDLLLYEDRIIDTPALTLPHPAISKRMFVLAPLCAISPDRRDPRTGRTMLELKDALSIAADWGTIFADPLDS